MATKLKVDGNNTGLRIATEASLKTLTGSPTFYPYEPNKYGKFGGEYKTEKRKPITSDRMTRKGPITDLDAMAEFDTDLTYGNLQQLLDGFFFANYRSKATVGGAGEVTQVTASSKTYTVSSGGAAFRANDLVLTTGFTNSANNGIHKVASSTGTTVVGVETNVDEGSPPAGAKLTVVGYQFSNAGEVAITAAGGAWPRLTRSTGTKDFTQFGLVVGEWIYIGDDTGTSFATAACNGWARIRSVSSTYLEFDKTAGVMVADDGSGKTIKIYFGRALKNELAASQVRKTYQLERLLGAPETSSSTNQSEYITGCIPDEITFNLEAAKKVEVNVKFTGMDYETRDYTTGPKSATRPALTAEDAFNFTNHAKRIKLARVPTTGSAANACPTPICAFVESLKLSIKNSIELNKAGGTLGAFEGSTGDFEPSVELKTYFQTVESSLVRSTNANVTVDVVLVKANQGIVVDLPLIGLTDGIPEVEKDKPIMVPVKGEASNAVDVDPAMTHAALMMFFDYLPSVAN